MDPDWIECSVEGCIVKTPNGECISCFSLRMAKEARERNKVLRVGWFESREATELYRKTGRTS